MAVVPGLAATSMSEQRVPAVSGEPMNKPPLLKWLLISVGVVCVGLATIGIFVPLLPTTPLLLVAAACFMRSSDRLYQRLITHRAFGPYIRNYQEHRAITRRARIMALLLLWTTLGYTTFWIVGSIALRVILLSIATAVTVHLVRLKTLADNGPPEGSNGVGGS